MASHFRLSEKMSLTEKKGILNLEVEAEKQS